MRGSHADHSGEDGGIKTDKADSWQMTTSKPPLDFMKVIVNDWLKV